jgi:putative transposase
MHYQNNILGKILTPLNRRKFKRFVDKYNGDYRAKKLTCLEQFIAIFLGQIGNCSSLREIENTIKFHANEHYHLGLRGNIARSTLANANENRDWRIYRDIFFDLVGNLKFSEQNQTRNLVKIIDSTAIPLDFEQHQWAERNNVFRGLKTHVVFNLQEKIPTYFTFTQANISDIKEARKLEIETRCTYVVDRGYLDFNWLKSIDDKKAFFVTRLKKNSAITALSDIQITNETISSQIIEFSRRWNNCGILNTYHKKQLKKVIVQRDGKNPLILITNDFKRSDEEIAELYKQRWQIELFFKWIKQNLKIKKFLGRSENAIKTQICIAMIGFVLIRLMEKLKEFCKKVSIKTLITIAKNGLFSRLSTRKPPPKASKSFLQLQFSLIYSP